MIPQGLIFEQIITGISIGSRLFLVAVGLSLIFGVLDVLNFTHGVLYMIGAYMPIVIIDDVLGSAWLAAILLGIALVVVGAVVEHVRGADVGRRSLPLGVAVTAVVGVLGGFGLFGGALAEFAVAAEAAVGGFWLGVLLSVALVGLVGIALEAGFVRRVYGRGHLDQLLLTFAFVLILTDAMRFLLGSGSHVINPPPVFRFTIDITSTLSVPAYRAFVVLLSIAVLAAIFVVLRTTNVGRVVRATSSDRDMASLLGINVPRLYTGVFFVGAALAGLGGAFAAPLQSVTVDLGNQVIINAFVVVVIGGLGSFTGAFVGAYVIGLMWALGTSAGIAGAGQLIPFLAMIVVLLLKPEGLFGGIEA